MKYNFVTVNFNTPELVDALIKSIYKNSGIPKNKINIIVFDNSDEKPFISDEVTVIDNTKGQIIDFEKWLSTFPHKRSRKGTHNNYGSDKHCYTIEWLIHHIKGGFLLLDSDTLIKRSVKHLFDNSVPYVGEIEPGQRADERPRILPYICYLNTDYIVKHNIKYFDDKCTYALNKKVRSKFDTGAAFLKNLYEVKGRIIFTSIYILHFQSCWKKGYEYQKEWLYENRLYYTVC